MYKRIETGEEFEDYVIEILQSAGTEATATPKSHDYGADIIAERDGCRYAIQCKFYKSPVGISAVQEIISALKFYNARYGAVITNSTYTQEARNLAEANGICLIDGDMLMTGSLDTNLFLESETPGDFVENDWNVTDLTIRYGVKKNVVHQYFMSKGMPYYKLGREYRFKPRDIREWEIETREVTLPNGKTFILPEYENYCRESVELLQQYRDNLEWCKARKLKKEMRAHGVETESNPMVIGLPAIFLGGAITAFLDKLW